MVDSIDSVNEIIAQLREWAKSSKEPVVGICNRHAEALGHVIDEIERLRLLRAPLPTRLGDLSDIPPELRAELSGIEIDDLEGQLIQVIQSYGGTADLNQILVGLFRKFKVVQTRRFAQQKLWRMTTDHVIWSVPKRKGVYSIKNPTEALDAIAAQLASVDVSVKSQPRAIQNKGDDDEIPL
jgi:hypothetical protein